MVGWTSSFLVGTLKSGEVWECSYSYKVNGLDEVCLQDYKFRALCEHSESCYVSPYCFLIRVSLDVLRRKKANITDRLSQPVGLNCAFNFQLLKPHILFILVFCIILWVKNSGIPVGVFLDQPVPLEALTPCYNLWMTQCSSYCFLVLWHQPLIESLQNLVFIGHIILRGT